MCDQLHLFPPHLPDERIPSVPPAERFEAAMVGSAIGDALGWATEYLREGGREPEFGLPVTGFVKWGKRVGGRFAGYWDDVLPGEYSDDTQLMLAVARSISEAGRFEPERFAYLEYPLWLQYARGAGRAVKVAAKSLMKRNADWQRNFYVEGKTDYREAGANGAAMRSLPLALVLLGDEARLVVDCFLDAIISHGHPRAILGAILFCLAVKQRLTEPERGAADAVETLCVQLKAACDTARGDARIQGWMTAWGAAKFGELLESTCSEACGYLRAIPEHLDRTERGYYEAVGALDRATSGSGLATTCAALYLSFRFASAPTEALLYAANALGSDTDSIAAFVGALVGARHGRAALPDHLWEGVQDREYLVSSGRRLHGIASRPSAGDAGAMWPSIARPEAHRRVQDWGERMSAMFDGEVSVGGQLQHPTLGLGTVEGYDERPTGTSGQVARLVRVAFACGQSCQFCSRHTPRGPGV